MRVLVAGGGTAGHVEPAMNTADELRRLYPDTEVYALGTRHGLEATLVPARGYELRFVPATPLPRRINAELFKTPGRIRTSVRQTRKVIAELEIDVVVGFGGYVSMPAYLAARRRVPVVIHEANAKAGVANKVAARWARFVTQATDGSIANAQTIGMPLRQAIADLDRGAQRGFAREHFGVRQSARTLLVFGGSLGARRINDALLAGLPQILAADIDVIHIAGGKNDDQVAMDLPSGGRYMRLAYCDRMDLAYAAADLALCRAGAMTCAEVATVGLPAIYVPLPIGNGEQRLNAMPTVRVGGGLLMPDSELSARNVADMTRSLLSDDARLRTMGQAARTHTSRAAAARLAELVHVAGLDTNES